MSTFLLGWGQAGEPAPAQSSPIPEAAAVPESQLDSNASRAGVQDLADDSSALAMAALQNSTAHNSTISTTQTTAVRRPQSRGFLHIVRHGIGASAIYVVTYRRLDGAGGNLKPVLAEGSGVLIQLLERLGVDFNLREVRGALADVLRLGSANIPDLWLSDEEMLEKGLVEG
jgi:hypothetical protein